MSFGLASLGYAQMGGMGGVGGGMGSGIGGGMPNVPGTAFGGATDPSAIRTGGGLRIIPSVQVSERYDSNVFFSPKGLLQGLTPEDFVTTVSPQVRGLYTDREKLLKVNVVAGAVGSYYANNTGLSYVGANAGMVIDMSDLLSQWRPGTKWTVSDTFFYSPQPPAFLLGDQSGVSANPLVAGFQATRTNTNSNSVNTLFEFPISTMTKVSGSYTHSFIHYRASQVPQAFPLISQETHTYLAGLVTQVTAQDTVRADFVGSEFNQGGLGAFSARGGIVGWTHNFSHTISLNATAGVQILSGESTVVRISSAVAPLGSLAIRWNNPTTSLSLAYRSGITPSFQFQSAPMLNHSVSFNMTQTTPIPDLMGLLGANYSVANEYGANSGGALSWATVGGTAGLQYRATQKMFLMLTYVYQNVDNVFAGTHFAYDRHATQLSLAQAFY